MISVFLAAAAVGLLGGRFLGTTLRRRGVRPAPTEGEPAAGSAPTPASDEDRTRGLPCHLGDVVLLASGDEAWLAGALLFSERAHADDTSGRGSRTVAALFVAPDKGGDRAVYARAAPEGTLDWMIEVTGGAVVVGREAPSAILHDGVTFERARRLPFAVEPLGEGAPDLGERAVVAEYDGGGGARLLVVIGGGAPRMWRGRRLEAGLFEVLPSADRKT